MIERNQVDKVCDTFMEQTNIEVTGKTRELITTILSAIEEDPHPAWRVEEDVLRLEANALLEEMPLNFRRIVRQTHELERITTYHFLHWLTKHLDPLCPFEKD